MARLAGVYFGSLQVTYAIDDDAQQGPRVNRLPALVAFSDTAAPYVSDDEGLRLWLDYPDRCAPAFIRMLAPVSQPEQVSALAYWFPYELETLGNEPRICLRMASRNGDRLLNASEVFQGYLRELMPKLGRCNRVAMALPPCFGPRAAEVVGEAALQAGILGVHACFTSVALAAHLATTTQFTNQVVALCGLSGGTFDVTMLYIGEGGAYEVLGTAGDALLGSLDFDMTIAAWLESQIRHLDPAVRWIDSRYSRARLLNEAMALRQLLGTQPEVSVLLPFLAQQGSGDVVHFPTDGTLSLQRHTAAALLAPLLGRVELVCAEALNAASLSRYDIDAVLLASEQPAEAAFQDVLDRVFGRRPHLMPDVAQLTALGATLLAHMDERQQSPFAPLSVRSGAPVLAALPSDKWADASRIAQRQPAFGAALAAGGTRFLEFYAAATADEDVELVDVAPALMLRLYQHGGHLIAELPAQQKSTLLAGLRAAHDDLTSVADEDFYEFLLVAARSSVTTALDRYKADGVAGLATSDHTDSQASTILSWLRARLG